MNELQFTVVFLAAIIVAALALHMIIECNRTEE